jgi:hypothetical protein
MSNITDALGITNKSGDAANEAGRLQADAAKSGSQLQYDAILKAIEEGKRQFGENKATLDPYNQGGQKAFAMQQDFSGANGADAQKAAYDNFQNSPGQQYLREQSEKALLRSAASTGGVGGSALKAALQKNAIGLASQDYQNQFNNLGSLTGVGLGAAGGLVNSGNATSQNAQNLLTQGGNALAGGETNSAAARASGILTGQQANAANQNQLIGLAATAAGGIFSDKNMKYDIKNLDLKQCFDAVKSLPLKSWRYLKEVGIDEDIHFGPMAQDAPEFIKIPGREALSIHDELMMIAGAIQYMTNNKMFEVKHEL